MTLTLTQDPQYQLLDWARPRCGCPGLWPKESEAIGVMDGDQLRAVMVLNAFYDEGCTVHFASDHTRRWATRNVLGGLFGYIFEYRRLGRAQLVIPATNRRAMVAGIKLGFVPEGRMRGGATGGDDAIVMSMLAHECPWTRRTAMGPDAVKDDGHG